MNITQDVTSNFDQEDINKTKGLCFLAYVGLLFLVPFLVYKDSAYVKFHCNQGLILFIAGVIISIVTKLLVNAKILGIVGVVLGGIISLPCTIVMTIVTIMGIVYSVTGKAMKFPVIGDIQLLK